MTEVTGEVFSGRSARTVSSRNSHGQREKQVDTGSYRPLPPAAQVSGSAADQRGDQRGKQCGRGGEQQRNTGSIQQARKAVAAQLVGSEQKSQPKAER